MNHRAVDERTPDLFPTIPHAADLTAPTMDLKVRIAHTMSQAMKAATCDRYEIAARMSRILGHEVTKNILDAYASAAKAAHIPNLAFCIAFDAATGTRALLNLYAALSGCSVLVGSDALRGELVRLEMQKEQIRKQERALKSALARSSR